MATTYAIPPVPSPLTTVAVAIANGTALSDIVDLKGYSLVGIQMPAAWTAADLTFQASADGTTFENLHVDTSDTEYTVQAAASRYIAIPLATTISVRFLKVRSGTPAVPVNQGADRVLRLIARHSPAAASR